MTEIERAMDDAARAALEVSITIRDRFTPAIKEVERKFSELLFSLWLGQQPRYLRRLMRFAYRIERMVLHR